MYNDYISWDWKRYPKEWFTEEYSAKFENFMLPIPNGYDELLRTVYGDYNIRVKGSALHEYPYYARQLRQLREYVKDAEQRLQDAGVKKKEERPDPICPATWEEMIEGKKVVLFIDDMQLSAEFGEAGLHKLEEVLDTFYQYRDKVVLWWKPQSQMRTLLSLVSPKLPDRYTKLLEEYKQTGWGICDESDDDERALKYCDAYYGAQNYLEAEFEGKKPVMIQKIVK